ncbi:MAG: hypothetical protein R2707_11395 [Acidimicrobiales bacterium]
MPFHDRARVAGLLLACFAIVVSACSSDGHPYDALSDAAESFVIPDSASWSSGELCPDGGACSGAITIEVIEHYDWLRVSGLAVNGAARDATVEVSLEVTETRSAVPLTGSVGETSMWGPDVDDVESVLQGGYDLWAGVDRESDYAVVFVAFDAEGRFAAVGHVAADFFTVPVARFAVDANARSGFEFLDPLMDA